MDRSSAYNDKEMNQASMDNPIEGLVDKKELGSGKFGDVYQYFDSGRGCDVAVKTIELINKFDGIPSNILREISILKDVKHDNVLSLLDVCVAGEKIYMIFELLDVDLLDFIANETPSLPIIKNVLYGILSGLKHLHENGIIHRDLCPANVLLDKERRVKIGDFGLARYTSDIHERYTHTDCTYEYTAPEQLLSAPYSFPADIWATGCIFAEMVKRGQTLMRYNRELAAVASIARVLGTPHETTWPGVTQHAPSLSSVCFQPGQGLRDEIPSLDDAGLNLLSDMLVEDPRKRITAEAALNHSFFNDVGCTLTDAGP